MATDDEPGRAAAVHGSQVALGTEEWWVGDGGHLMRGARVTRGEKVTGVAGGCSQGTRGLLQLPSWLQTGSWRPIL